MWDASNYVKESNTSLVRLLVYDLGGFDTSGSVHSGRCNVRQDTKKFKRILGGRLKRIAGGGFEPPSSGL